MDLDLDDLLASQVPADENNKRTPGQSVTKRAKDGGDENMLDGDFFNFESSSLSKSFRGSTDLDFDNEPPARKKKAVVAEDDDLGLDFLDLQKFSIFSVDDDWCTPKLAPEDICDKTSLDKQNKATEISTNSIPSDVEMVPSDGDGEGYDGADSKDLKEPDSTCLTMSPEPPVAMLPLSHGDDGENSPEHGKPEQEGEARSSNLGESSELTVPASPQPDVGIMDPSQNEDEERNSLSQFACLDRKGETTSVLHHVSTNSRGMENCVQKASVAGEHSLSLESPIDQTPHHEIDTGHQTLAESGICLENDVVSRKPALRNSPTMTSSEQLAVPLTPSKPIMRMNDQKQRPGITTSPVSGLIHEKGQKVLQNVIRLIDQDPQMMHQKTEEAPETPEKNARSDAHSIVLESDVPATTRGIPQENRAPAVTQHSNFPSTPRRSGVIAVNNEGGCLGSSLEIRGSTTKQKSTFARLLETPARTIRKPLSLSVGLGVLKVRENDRPGLKPLKTLELTKLTRVPKDTCIQDATKHKASLQLQSSKEVLKSAVPATPRTTRHKSLEKLVSREADDTERRTGIKKGHPAASHMGVEGDLPMGHDLQKMYECLKQKHEEAKDLLLRSLVTNNMLRMLDNPMNEEKIRSIRRSIEDRLPATMGE